MEIWQVMYVSESLCIILSARRADMSKYIKKWRIEQEKLIRQYPIFSLFEMESSSALDEHKKGSFVYLDCPNWVNVIALTSDEELVLVEQYRHGIRDITLEIPGGLCDEGESILETGIRELAEETGYVGSRAELIGTVQPNPAYQNNLCHTIVVYDVEKKYQQDLDEHEEIQVHLHRLDYVDQLVREGKIQNSMVISALYFFHNIQKNKSN